MEEARKGDDSLNVFSDFIAAWWACSGTEDGHETAGLRATDLISKFKNDYNVDRDTLEGEALVSFDKNNRFQMAIGAFGNNSRDQLTNISLGGALKKHKDAVVGGIKLVSTYDTNRHVNVWKLKSLRQGIIAPSMNIAA
jgi:hypothetical protein